MKIVFKKTSKTVKYSTHLQRNVFVIYSPKVVNVELASYVKIDTGLVLSLPQNSKGFVTSIFRGDEIIEFNTDKERLLVEILNKSFEEPIKIKKNQPVGFVVIEPEHFKFKYETPNEKKKKTIQKKKLKKQHRQTTIQATWRLS